MAKFHLTTKLGYFIYCEVDEVTYYYRGGKGQMFSDNPIRAKKYTTKENAQKVVDVFAERSNRPFVVTTIQ